MSSDGIHPNQNGDAHIADAFLTALEANNDCPTPPLTLISSPLNDGDSLPATHTFTGSAFDAEGDGIQRVRIAIENNNFTTNNNRWFNFATRQFDAYSEIDATLSNTTPNSADWSISTVLPSGGDYRIYALAVDSLGVLLSRVLAMDQTPCKVGKSKKKKGKMHQGYFWPMYGDKDEIVFTYSDSRARRVIEQLLNEQFSGTLISDG